MQWSFLTHVLKVPESLVQCHLGKVEAKARDAAYMAQGHGALPQPSLANESVTDAARVPDGKGRQPRQSPHPHTWSSAMILSPSSSSSSFEEEVVTGGGDGAQAEAGSSAGHFVALACRLGPASSLLA